MFVLIPAYCPDEKLLSVVSELTAQNDYSIVVVDDGSESEYAGVFDALCSEEFRDNVTILRHAENRGKGAALKTGLEYIKSAAVGNEGIITVDADGQHLPDDVRRTAAAWRASPSALIIGSRRFTGTIPVRSHIGNAITRSVFAITTGVRVYDTQSGLRAFSAEYIDDMLGIKGDRYDYEINQLLFATKHNIPIIEEPIETVYDEGNRSSHFKVFKDSWLIYRTILVFMLSSFSCFVIDYTLLLVLDAVFRALPSAYPGASGKTLLPVFGKGLDTHLLALIIARAVSSFCNYLLNRKVVFKAKSSASIVRFYMVIIFLLLANYGLLALVSTGNGMPLWIAQLVVQAVLYPLSFVLQRKFVFPTKAKAE